MRLLILLVLVLLVFPVSSYSQDNQVFDCVVTQVTAKTVTIVCDTRSTGKACKPGSKHPNCVHATFDIPKKNWNEFPEWGTEWEPMEAGGWRLVTRFPERGDLLKAQWPAGRQLQSVASCEKRIQAAIDEYCGDHYCRPPINALTPLDCGPPSAFIRKLLKRIWIDPDDSSFWDKDNDGDGGGIVEYVRADLAAPDAARLHQRMSEHEHIGLADGIFGGVTPVVSGIRISVQDILTYLYNGNSIEYIAETYGLTPEAIKDAIAFAQDVYDDAAAALRAEKENNATK